MLDSSFSSDNLDESDIHTKLYKASGDGILEPNEFKKWCSAHYQEVLGWFDDVLKSERNVLVAEGKIEETESGIFKSKKYIVDSSLKDEAIQLKGLKNFLKDLTLIKEKEALQVHLLEEYLMFAQMFGIAKEVAKEFEELYPKVIEENGYNYDFVDVLFISNFAYMGIARANSAASMSSYSGGGGGFSAGGGRFRLIWRTAAVAAAFVS